MNGTCKDCGGPVHLASVTCAESGTQVYYHDSAAGTWACPGSSMHVQVAAA